MKFSLRTMAIAITVGCVYLALLSAPPHIGLLAMVMLTLANITGSCVAAVLVKSEKQPFWIGCATVGICPWLIAFFLSLDSLLFTLFNVAAETAELRVLSCSIAVCHLLAVFGGYLVLLADKRRRRKRRQSPQRLHPGVSASPE